jgi:hypothetical protein
MLTNANILRQKALFLFMCELCDFNCSKKSDYVRHLSTGKHKNANNANIYANILHPKNATPPPSCVSCDGCARQFKHRSSLSRHKKICCPTNDAVDVDMPAVDMTAVILELVKSNTDLQKQMLEVCKNSNNTIISNSHNKTFNMQFFLNEQCKDAMNLMEFVDSFKLQFADLEQVGEMGYIEGLSNIIMKKLNEMDVHKRPIHCSDAKREIMYVKDDNVWEKEKPTCDKLRKAIKYISKKNSDLIPAWNMKNPLANNFASQVNDQYLQIIKQSMGGSGEIEDSETKIIKKLAKAVLIDKDC